MKMSDKIVDIVADLVLGEESIADLGGKETIRERVKGYLEQRFGSGGWTCVGLSILAWGKKPMSN